jgi:hypothetical protein
MRNRLLYLNLLSFVFVVFTGCMYRTSAISLWLTGIEALPDCIFISAGYFETNRINSFLLTSYDRGSSWEMSGFMIKGGSIADMATAGEYNVWLLTLRHEEEGVLKPHILFRSKDKGRTWEKFSLNFIESTTGIINNFLICFSDEKNGVLLLDESNRKTYYVSHDSGASWLPEKEARLPAAVLAALSAKDLRRIKLADNSGFFFLDERLDC